MRTDTIRTPKLTSPRRLTNQRPRLGFLGVGWIGLHRLKSLVGAGLADVVAIADRDQTATRIACEAATGAEEVQSLEELLDRRLDGIVIATPSALHADQALQALNQGVAVFCQKPLARTAPETRGIINAAREADVLLGVDFCYRHVRGVRRMRQLVQSGAIGDLFAIDLTFHNAYGPDKSWFYERERSGGGCVIDLGIHLVDLAGWLTSEWEFNKVRSSLFHQGQRLTRAAEAVEDCAFADWSLPNGATVRLACSWRLSAGQDACIEAIVYGTRGALALRNINGSFYDFIVEHWEGTQRKPLSSPETPQTATGAETAGRSTEHCDDWGKRALNRWARALAGGAGFDEEIEHAASVAEVIDHIYGRETLPTSSDISRSKSPQVPSQLMN